MNFAIYFFIPFQTVFQASTLKSTIKSYRTCGKLLLFFWIVLATITTVRHHLSSDFTMHTVRLSNFVIKDP